MKVKDLTELLQSMNQEENIAETPYKLIGEYFEMREAFFKLRKDAFLSRLDRFDVMETAVKFVGNKPK